MSGRRLRWVHCRRREAGGAAGAEKGAVLVEFAFVAMILLALLAGAFDYGRAWRVGLAANEAARTGARVGSGQGDAETADFSLLSGMKSALESSGQLGNVTRVVIFEADRDDGEVPQACVTGNGSSSSCNILTGEQFRALPETSGGSTLHDNGCIRNSTTKRFCPTNRNSIQISADYLGIWVQVRYDFMFPVLGSTQLVERTVVMRLEPKDS